MAYEVTATRRRPQQFENLVGQEFVAETLKNAINTKQIAHAYLFSGPRGCGKTSTARILAKALNCQNQDGPTSKPCGQCAACKAITQGASLDVIEIDGASNTSVNDVRQIKDEVMFPPNSCRYKIYIIDEVHMLSTSAFNALLKTIEEPPSYAIFIFATTELQKVPATIKSRCQQYNFRLVNVERLKNLLRETCQEMNIQAEDEALYWISKESGGSVRDSYTLFDQIAAFSEGNITYNKIRDKLGLVGVERLNEIFELALDCKSEKVLELLDSFLQSGISIEQLISNTSEYVRSLLLIKNGIQKESLLGQNPDRYSKRILQTLNIKQIERAMSIFLNLYRDIRYSLSPRYELELAFSRLCTLKEYVSPQEVKEAIDKAHYLLRQCGDIKTITEEEKPKEESIESKIEDNLPPGVPRFAIFDKPKNPFNEGGAIPPEQTADTLKVKIGDVPNFSFLKKVDAEKINEINTTISDSPKPIETSIKENISTNVEVPIVEPTIEIPTLKIPDKEPAVTDDYDYNPDEWQTSPEGEEFSDDWGPDVEEFSEPDIEEPQISQPKAPVSNSIIINNQELPIDDIKQSLSKGLSSKNGILSQVILTIKQWNLNNDIISLYVDNSYQKQLLEQYSKDFIDLFYRLYSKNISLQVYIIEENHKEIKKEIPEQVNMLCKVFKGTIV